MEKVVNEAHRSKFQTLEQFYTSEDLLVLILKRPDLQPNILPYI